MQSKLVSLKKSLRQEDPANPTRLESLVSKLEKSSTSNPKVWLFLAQYYFQQMQKSSTNEQRLAWAQKANQYAWKALKGLPADAFAAKLFQKTSRWVTLLSDQKTQ